MLLRHGSERNKFPDAGIGENNIDSPLHPGDRLVETIEVRQLGNVPLNSGDVGSDCLDRFVQFLLAAPSDENVSTLFGEKFCRSQPNSLCPAGYDCGLAFEFLGHHVSFAPFKKKSIVTGLVPGFRQAWRVPFCTTTSPRLKDSVLPSSNSSPISPS